MALHKAERCPEGKMDLVLDSSQPLDEHDFDLLSETDCMRRLVVANKHDLTPAWTAVDFAEGGLAGAAAATVAVKTGVKKTVR